MLPTIFLDPIIHFSQHIQNKNIVKLLNVQMVLSTCEAAGKNYIFDKGPTYMK